MYGMTLLEKQQLFTELLPDLLIAARELGYKVTIGDAFRDPRVHGHVGEKKSYSHSKSCHKLKLAIDLNLYKDGKYLTETKDHEKLGWYWETLHPLCSWGGHFNDGNHYSLKHDGMR